MKDSNNPGNSFPFNPFASNSLSNDQIKSAEGYRAMLPTMFVGTSTSSLADGSTPPVPPQVPTGRDCRLPSLQPVRTPAEFLDAVRHDVEVILAQFCRLPIPSTVGAKRIWKDYDFGIIYALGFSFISTQRIIDFIHEIILEVIEKCFFHNVSIVLESHLRLQSCILFIFLFWGSQPGGEGYQSRPISIRPELFSQLLDWLRTMVGSGQREDAVVCLGWLLRERAFSIRLGLNPGHFAHRQIPSLVARSPATMQLQEQLLKIEQTLNRDCIPASHMEEMSIIARKYDSVMERHPELHLFTLHGFPKSLQTSLAAAKPHLSSSSVERSPPITAIIAGAKRRGTVAATSGEIFSRGSTNFQVGSFASDLSKRRRSTSSRTFIPPTRSATAPPTIASQLALESFFEDVPQIQTRDSTQSQVNSSSAMDDMPDLSFYLNS